MTVVREMLDATAVESTIDLGTVAQALEAIEAAERTATSCAAAMVAASGHGDNAEAIRADLDFVDICQATHRVLARSWSSETRLIHTVLDACIIAGERSNAQCRQHAHHHAHCRLCSEASLRAVEACRRLLVGLA